jgi:hypothetical protein
VQRLDALADQSGVVARRQLVAAGVTDAEIRRWRRRRELVAVHPGVYADHTGPLTWQQRAWAAVLFCGRAALAGESAMRAADGPGRPGAEDGPIRVVVDRRRRVVAPRGIVVTRSFDLDARVLWNVGPPRLRYEEAAIDVALAARAELVCIGVVARAVQNRRTTAARMSEALRERKRAPRRDVLSGILDDVAQGTCSVLEHAFLVRVERPHGLPTAERQLPGRASSGVVYRDVAYGSRLVELDGRLFHDTAEQRDRDFERDLDAAVEGQHTVRLSWGQVFDRPCATAARLGRLLEVPVRPCGPGCAVGPE